MENTIDSRNKLAETYVDQAIPVEDIITMAAINLSLQYPKEHRKIYEKAIRDYLDKEKTKKILIAALLVNVYR